MTLAEQLVALCKEHGLRSLSVDVHISEDIGVFFGSYAHRDGKCGSASVCRTSPMEAIGEAIADVRHKLGLGGVDVPELESEA